MQPLCAEEIRRATGEEIAVFVFETVDSTNTEARRRLAAAPETRAPAVFVAETQSSGRGRRGKSFFSPRGGLYLTVSVPVEVGRFDPIGITVSASVEASRAISDFSGAKVGIKWVNDLYDHEKKIAGILAEAITDPKTGSPSAVIVGIGVNLFAPSCADLPEAGGLFAPGTEVGRNELAGKLAKGLLRAVRAPLGEGILAEYRRRSVVLGRSVRFSENGVWRSAFAEDIRKDGALCVLLPDGTRKALESGEISLRAEDAT